ncbi:hypothetical protein F8564_10105 [Serratia sp. RJAL6]|nr:hypothetical protein F8564_10105 [Enterobacter sp. RJAL6]
MSGFKGTPGPWVIDKYGRVVDSVGMTIAVRGIANPMVADPECLANSKLVSAAPEILDALQELVFLYEHDEGCRELTEYKRAKEAIKKALGN